MQEVVKSALIRHLLSEVIRRPHNRHLRSQKLLLSKVTIVSGKSFGTLYFFLMFSTFATTSPPSPPPLACKGKIYGSAGWYIVQ